MRESGKDAFKRALKYSRRVRSEIEREVASKNKVSVRLNGPRAIFMEKYKENKNIEEGKDALVAAGFSLKLFNDNILKNWIEEERNDDGR